MIDKKTTVTNSAWKLLESFSTKGITLVVSVILARILDPKDFGIISLTAIYTQLSDILVQAGFATALIRKEKVDDNDYSTVLFISVLSAIVLYSIVFFTAPVISQYFDVPILSLVLRILCLTIFCQAFTAVRTAVVTREMRFHEMFQYTLVSNVISGVIGIVMAITGSGIWALVIQQLLQQVIFTILMQINVAVKIKFFFSKESFKEIFPFSIKVLTSSLLSFLGDSLYSIAIGKAYSVEDLGFYNKGSQFPRQFSLYTFGAVSSVILPTLSSYQSDLERLNNVMRKVIAVTCFVIFPLMTGLACVASNLITVLFTEKWLPITGILQWNCLYYAATPILLMNVQFHFALGKGETRIHIEIFRIILMVIMFVVAVVLFHVSITNISALLAGIQVIVTAAIVYATFRASGYHVMDSIKDVFPMLISCTFVAIVVLLMNSLNLHVFLELALQVVVGAGVYTLSSWLISKRTFLSMLKIVQTIVHR